MKKVIVTKVKKIGADPYFKVTLNGDIVRVFSFRLNEPPESIYNEESSRLEAMKLAAEIENGASSSEEVIYESE